MCRGTSESVVSAQMTSGVSSDRKGTRRRAVLVLGVRTPFVRAFGSLRKVEALELSVAAVQGLITKAKLDPRVVDEVIFGNVVMSTAAPNLAREIVIGEIAMVSLQDRPLG